MINTNCLINLRRTWISHCLSRSAQVTWKRCHHKGATYTWANFFLMYFFVPSGTHRLILNFKRFNESVSHYHFKMDSLSTITKLVTQNCYKASVDMKDAYYSIPIRSSDRKFLRFTWDGELYEFTCFLKGCRVLPIYLLKFLSPSVYPAQTRTHSCGTYWWPLPTRANLWGMCPKCYWHYCPAW